MHLSNNSSAVDANFSLCTTSDQVDDIIAVSIWGLLLIYGLATNLLTLAAIFRNVTLRSSTSYWLIFNLAFCDIIMIIISLVHLLPAALLHDRFVHVESYRNAFAIFFYNIFWYAGVLGLCAMALNRFVSIMFPMSYPTVFSRRNTALFICCLYAGGLIIALPAAFQCCLTIWNHHCYLTHFVFEAASEHYGNVDLAVNSMSVIVMAACYACILVRVRQSRLASQRHRAISTTTTTLSTATNVASNRNSVGRKRKNENNRAKNDNNNNDSNTNDDEGADSSVVPADTTSNGRIGTENIQESHQKQPLTQRISNMVAQARHNRGEQERKLHGKPSTGGIGNSSGQHPHCKHNKTPHHHSIQSREMRLFIQFFAVSVVFLATFITWQITFRLLSGTTNIWIFFAMTGLFFVNNATSPTIYIIFNSALRSEIRTMLGRLIPAQLLLAISSSSGSNNNHDNTNVNNKSLNGNNNRPCSSVACCSCRKSPRKPPGDDPEYTKDFRLLAGTAGEGTQDDQAAKSTSARRLRYHDDHKADMRVVMSKTLAAEDVLATIATEI